LLGRSVDKILSSGFRQSQTSFADLLLEKAGTGNMGFGNKKEPPVSASMDRLAAVAGGAPAAAPAVAGEGQSGPKPQRRKELQIDVTRIRPRQIEETAEQRKRRLAAKTVNFTATIIARVVIIVGAGIYGWDIYESTGQVHRGVAIGIIVMIGDLGRVVMKASEPGTK
jgi:hypothetical protein